MSNQMLFKLKDKLSITKGIPFLEIGITVATAIRVMRQTRSVCMIVKDRNGEICGIISETDIIDSLAELGDRALKEPIDAYITMDLICCSEEQTIHEVLSVMSAHRIRHMPIVTSTGHLVSFVSVLDILSMLELPR
jgi:CBS domain-containing protein